jgi:exportin-2 (importin alpha re-exporter)
MLITNNAGDSKTLTILFDIMFLMEKIFFYLHCQDLPEFFEDHHDEFMNLFSKYLQYSNPLYIEVFYLLT